MPAGAPGPNDGDQAFRGERGTSAPHRSGVLRQRTPDAVTVARLLHWLPRMTMREDLHALLDHMDDDPAAPILHAKIDTLRENELAETLEWLQTVRLDGHG